jgi:hypothetical protein
MNSSNTKKCKTVIPGIAALGIALLSIAAPIPGFIALYNVRPGIAYRPMGQAISVFVFGIGTPLAAIAFGLFSLSQGRTGRILGCISILLSCVPLPLYTFLLHWISNLHDLFIDC